MFESRWTHQPHVCPGASIGHSEQKLHVAAVVYFPRQFRKATRRSGAPAENNEVRVRLVAPKSPEPEDVVIVFSNSINVPPRDGSP